MKNLVESKLIYGARQKSKKWDLKHFQAWEIKKTVYRFAGEFTAYLN